MKTLLRTRKNKKALSGAVTALILVIASVIITLVVVGFAFGLFGAFGGTPTVSQVGTGTLNSSGVATFTLKSTGTVTIVSAQIVGTNYTNASPITPGTLSAGENTVTVTFNIPQSQIQSGSTYTISIALSDGATTEVTVIAQ